MAIVAGDQGLSPAAVADDPQERLGVPHHAYLLARVSSAPALPTRARSRLWPSFEGCPFALWTAFPPAEAGRHAGDYYEGSVAIGLASRRRSRVCAFLTSRARRRRPVRPLDQGRSLTPTGRSVPPTSCSRRIPVASRLRCCNRGVCQSPLGVGVQAIQLSPYRAGLAKLSLQHLPTASASTACSCPSWLSPPGQPLTQGSDAPDTLLSAKGIRNAPTRRTTMWK